MCLADQSQFSVLCTLGFLECMINPTAQRFTFYSVSCGPLRPALSARLFAKAPCEK